MKMADCLEPQSMGGWSYWAISLLTVTVLIC
jgi:hypothetical protein